MYKINVMMPNLAKALNLPQNQIINIPSPVVEEIGYKHVENHPEIMRQVYTNLWQNGHILDKKGALKAKVICYIGDFSSQSSQSEWDEILQRNVDTNLYKTYSFGVEGKNSGRKGY